MRQSVKKRRIHELMLYALAAARLEWQLDSIKSKYDTQQNDYDSDENSDAGMVDEYGESLISDDEYSGYQDTTDLEIQFEHCFSQYMALAEGVLSDAEKDARYLYQYAYNKGAYWISRPDRASDSMYMSNETYHAYYAKQSEAADAIISSSQDDQDVAVDAIISSSQDEQDVTVDTFTSSSSHDEQYVLADDSHGEQDVVTDSGNPSSYDDAIDEVTFARAFKEACSRLNDINPLNIKTRHPFFSSPNPSFLMPLPLHKAVCKNNIKAVQALLVDHALANAIDHQGNTALHQACARDLFPIIGVLLHHNVNTGIVNKQGFTALQEATTRRQILIVSLLLQHELRKKSDKVIPEILIQMIGDSAALCKHPEEMADFLLTLTDQGVLTFSNVHDLCRILDKHSHPIDCVASILLLHKENLLQTYLQNFKTTDPVELLHRAIVAKDAAFVAQLIAVGFDIELLDHRHQTPLHTSIREGNIETTSLLLFSGSNIMARDNSGWQPLHLASMNGDLDAVNAILQRSENGIKTCINSTTSDGQTALMIAKRYERHDIIALLRDYQSFRERLKRINFNGVIPEHMKCCISYEIINDPITVSSGITYDRAELSKCFGHNSRIKCPMTRGLFIHSQELQFKSTVFLKTLIEAFVTEQENAFLAQSTLIEEETSAGAGFRSTV